MEHYGHGRGNSRELTFDPQAGDKREKVGEET